MAQDAPQAPLDMRAQRRAALRQGLAGLAVLAPLLLALPFLGEDEPTPEPAPSAPIVSAAPEPAATSAAGGLASPAPASPAPQVDAQPAAVVEPVPVASSAAETPTDKPIEPPSVATQAPAGTAQSGVGSIPAIEAPAAEPVPPPVAERRYPPPPPGNGYMVQLGVFTDTENAAKLLLELAAAGHPVYLQSRVVLGPYPDKAAAQRAQEKIRRERKLDGMIVPPRKP